MAFPLSRARSTQTRADSRSAARGIPIDARICEPYSRNYIAQVRGLGRMVTVCVTVFAPNFSLLSRRPDPLARGRLTIAVQNFIREMAEMRFSNFGRNS